MKHYIIRILLIISIITWSVRIFAQENTNDYNGFDVKLSPRITIGYTFGAGVNCGFDLGISVYRVNNIMTGLHLNYYMVFVKNGGMHKIKGAMLSAETKYVTGHIGIGKVSRNWGLRNVNRAGTYGIMIDAAASFDEYKSPWIGFKTFIFNRQKWVYYDLPTYTSAYVYFKTQNIDIYKQDPPKIVDDEDE